MGYLRHTAADFYWVATERRRWLFGSLGIVLTFAAVTAIATFVGFLPFGAASPNPEEVVARLATGQAAVLGIVFSVGLVMLQLLSQRYSPALLYGLIQHPAFNLVFLLFIISIGVDLWILYNIPPETTLLVGIAVAGASGLAAAAIFSLLLVLKYGLKFSQPVAAVEDYLDTVFTDGKPSIQSITDSHSLDPVSEQITSEFGDGNTVTASKLATCYAICLFAELHHAFRADDFDNSRIAFSLPEPVDNTTKSVVDWFAHPVSQHLPTLAVTAYAERANDVGHTLVSTLFWVTVLGSEKGNSLAGTAHRALGDIVVTDTTSATGREDAVNATLLAARWEFERGKPRVAATLAEQTADWITEASETISADTYGRLVDRTLVYSADLVEKKVVTESTETESVDLYERRIDRLGGYSWEALDESEATDAEDESLSYAFADWNEDHRTLVGKLLKNHQYDCGRVFSTVQKHYERLLYQADDVGTGFVDPVTLILDLLQLTHFVVNQSDDADSVDGARLFADVRNYGYYHLVDEICERLTTEPEVDFDYDPVEGTANPHLVAGPDFGEDDAFGQLDYDENSIYDMMDLIERVHEQSRRRFWKINFEQNVQYVVTPESEHIHADLDEIQFGSFGSGVGRLFGVLRDFDVVVQITTAVTVDEATYEELIEKRDQLKSNEQLHVFVPGDEAMLSRSTSLDRLRDASVRVHEIPPEAFPKPHRPPDWQ